MVERSPKRNSKAPRGMGEHSFRFPDNTFPKKMLKPLKDVRKERQKPAHKVIENDYDPKFIDKQKKIVEACYISIGSLRRNLQTHPNAKSVELNAYLDDERVKYF